jgi:hypothetical protein
MLSTIRGGWDGWDAWNNIQAVAFFEQRITGFLALQKCADKNATQPAGECLASGRKAFDVRTERCVWANEHLVYR